MASLNSSAGALKFLKTTVDPKQYTTVPPNLFNQSTFPKNVSVSGNWNIRADTDIPGVVKDKSGVLLWQTQRGAASISSMGLVPASATPIPGTDIVSPDCRINSNQALRHQLTATREFAMPYSRGERNVNIAPDLSEDFSVARTYAGMLSLISDSVPIGNTALTGRFSGGTINDIRDISQTASGAYPSAALQQQTITNKDGIKNINVADGIVTVLGPDLNPKFSAPRYDTLTNFGVSDSEHLTVTMPTLTGAQLTIAAGNQGVAAGGIVFLTPVEGLELTNIHPTGTPVPVSSVAMAPLPYNTAARLRVNFPAFDVTPSGFFPGYYIFQPVYSCMHLYGSVNSDGRLEITNGHQIGHGPFTLDTPDGTFVGETRQEEVAGPGTTIEVGPQYVEFPLPVPNAGIADGLMYMGTMVWTNINNVGVTNYAVTVPDTSTIDVWVEALSLYDSGALGPTRVLRWDNLSAGQELKLDGVLLAQCVPEGQIAPFVSPTAQMQQVALHLNIYPWLNSVYNGTGPIKRVWKGSDYAKIVAMLRDNAVEDLMKLSKQDEQAGEAAGIFSAIGGGLGSLAGGGLGSMLDSVTGLGAGQFGDASSAKRLRY